MARIRAWLAVALWIVLATFGEVRAGGKPLTRTDCYGDLLPPGVLARLGTERFNHCHIVAISPDGKVVATGAYKKGVCLCDADTGKELRRISFSEDSIGGLFFSPDGKQLAAISSGGATIDLGGRPRITVSQAYDKKVVTSTVFTATQ